MVKWDDGWEDTPEDLPSLVNNGGNETEPGSTQDIMMRKPEEPSTEIVPTTAKALKAFAKIDSTKVEECLNGIKEITSIYTDLEKHLSTETEQTNRVYIESLRDIRIAHENSQAVIEQAYYKYQEVVAQCNKEIDLGKIDLEKDHREHERIMKMLNDAKDAFDQVLNPLKKQLESGIKQEEELLNRIINEKSYKLVEKFGDIFVEIKKLNSDVSKDLLDLRIQLSASPKV